MKRVRKHNFKLGGTLRIAVLASTVFVAGCQTTSFEQHLSGVSQDRDTTRVEFVEIRKEASALQVLVDKTRKEIEKGDLEEASKYSNLALKLDITNPDLQFLNGLVYHLIGVRGDSSKFRLAEQGYKQALNFDPGNLAARYQLGHLYMDQRRFQLAQENFAAVALHKGQDAAILYNLAAASYYARDPRTADAALERLMDVSPNAEQKAEILQAKALSLAALNDYEAAGRYIDTYRDVSGNTTETGFLEQRLTSWKSFYESDAKLMMAQYSSGDPYGSGTSNPYGSADPYGNTAPYGAQSGSAQSQSAFANTQAGTSGFSDPSMVVVDVVLIGTQEDIRDSRGINLLNGLQLQFGDPLTGAAGFGLTDKNVKDNLDSGFAESTRTITRSISIPAVTYSLNIANSLNANNLVLAKPSLVAQNGQTSEFFSGTEILAAAVSGGSGDSVSVQKEVGVKLAVTPEVLPDDMIRLHVVAERTFLTDPSNSVVFEFRLDTTKTNVNSTVTMKFGETLILGGLSERETSKSADGVPGLMDIPILNYLFSQRVEREFERSILILLTPRRPNYTRRADEDREKVIENMSELERTLQRLEQRHSDWYTPRPTFNEIRDKLQGREFFEEFRMGDVKVQSWHQDALQQDHIARVQKRLLQS